MRGHAVAVGSSRGVGEADGVAGAHELTMRLATIIAKISRRMVKSFFSDKVGRAMFFSPLRHKDTKGGLKQHSFDKSFVSW
jgi:hypothetical protein